MFGAPFLAPSSGYGGKQSCPKEGCLVTQGAAGLRCCSGFREERPYGLSRLCAGLQLAASSVTAPAAFTALPSPQGLKDCRDGVVMTCAEFGLK